MLSQLDNIIFPDRCDVLEIAAQRYVYPIFKNGSSTLNKVPHTVIATDRLSADSVVDVFVRPPYERFLSGVQTYLRHNTHLHRDTALHFISEYLFLNRHFCPQFHWLVNLNRHVPGIKIQLLPIERLSEITNIVENRHTCDPELIRYFANKKKVQFYLQLDKVITENLLHKTVIMSDIVREVATVYPDTYTEVIQRSLSLCTALD